jgi:hypothetical protein
MLVQSLGLSSWVREMEKKTERTPRVKNRTASGAQDEGGGVFPLYGGGLSVIKWRTTTTYK